jgi:hypothetical protein
MQLSAAVIDLACMDSPALKQCPIESGIRQGTVNFVGFSVYHLRDPDGAPCIRKNMRFVPIKTDDQLDLQAIHRIRDRLVSRRTAVINQIRAFLLERGMVFAQKPAKLKAAMADILENAEAT